MTTLVAEDCIRKCRNRDNHLREFLQQRKEGLLMFGSGSRKENQKKLKVNSLSNIQLELLKLYSTDMEDEDLIELKKILANHFARKAMDEADRLWDQKKMSPGTMKEWLNESFLTAPLSPK